MSKPAALIVGADHETGTALARQLVNDGYQVGSIRSSDRGLPGRVDDLEVTVDEQIELADHESLKAAIKRVVAQLDSVSTVFFNSCPVRSKSPLSLTPQELAEDLNSSVGAFLVVVQELLPYLASGACIVTVIAGAADRPHASAASLGVHQAGLRNLAKVVDQCLRDDGIRSVAVTIEAAVRAGQPSSSERIASAILDAARQDEARSSRSSASGKAQPPLGSTPFRTN